MLRNNISLLGSLIFQTSRKKKFVFMVDKIDLSKVLCLSSRKSKYGLLGSQNLVPSELKLVSSVLNFGHLGKKIRSLCN